MSEDTSSVSVTDVDGDTIDVGPLTEIPEGEFVITEIAGRQIGFIRRGDKVHAVRNICPHKTAPICKGVINGTMLPSDPGEFIFGLEGEVLQCPWHGWQFSLETGEVLFTGARNRLRLYNTSVTDGRVHVHLRGRPPRSQS